MAGKTKSKQEEALQFLDDLDNMAPPPAAALATTTTDAAPPGAEGEAEAYAFIEEMTRKGAEPPRTAASLVERPLSRAGTPTLRKSTERVKVGAAPTPLLPSASGSGAGTPLVRSESNSSRVSLNTSARQEAQQQPAASSSSGWGWGNVWSTATAAIQQAKTAVDEQVKNLPNNDQARKWSEGVLEYAKAAQLDKLGQDIRRVGLSTFTDILNAVAPPISEHEVIKVWLSHDMKGYDGVETLVYRALARIMEQVEGGDLIVNRGNESRPKDNASEKRELHAVEGLEAALKLAQVELEEIIKRNEKPPTTSSSAQNPTTYSYVYLRIQPFLTTLALPKLSDASETDAKARPSEHSTLQFILYLSDPSHSLTHSTVTQAVPGKWLDLWDEYEWVEDLVVEALRVGVEVIGQEYIVSRMGWDQKKAAPTAELPAEDAETKAA
ncbi:hypothetical protein EIP86_005840 [Pleurotus ostreatoroseus]|nr:hypothetical protein EIP86_005840 [Pleurotus ostreatoroseus]